MAFAQVLCNAFQERQRSVTVRDVGGLLIAQVTPSYVHNMRRTTLELISGLAGQESRKMY